jgi:hypothetical protein
LISLSKDGEILIHLLSADTVFPLNLYQDPFLRSWRNLTQDFGILLYYGTVWYLLDVLRIRFGPFASTYLNFVHTVKPAYNDHTWDPKIVAVVDRWSLFLWACVL